MQNLIDEIKTEINDIEKMIRGEPITFEDEDEPYFGGFNDTYEAIERSIEILTNIKSQIVRTHVDELEKQLTDKLTS